VRKLPPFRLRRASSTSEARELLCAEPDRTAFYAGGTELLQAMKMGVLDYRTLIDIKRIPRLREIESDGQDLFIGAAVTHKEVAESSAVRSQAAMLCRVAGSLANPRVRATGSIGGNLCFAEPHSDVAPVLMALGARCVVLTANGQANLTMESFVVGPFETALVPGDLLLGVSLPKQPRSSLTAYHSLRFHERPVVGIAVWIDLDAVGVVREARICVGSVTLNPVRATASERVLVGGRVEDPDHIDVVAAALDEDLEIFGDAEGSEKYKRHLSRVALRRALQDVEG